MSAPAYKTVPVEPTEAMLQAVLDTGLYHDERAARAVLADEYRSMLAAAPAVQAGGEPVAQDARDARIAQLELALTQAAEALSGGLWDYGPGQDEHERCNEVIAACRAALATPQEKS